VIHAGDDHWFLIDSCKAPETEQPASLEYLRSIGVDYSQAVKRIVISHWDQDHTEHIDNIVGACPDATVIMSEALRTEEFLGLADLHSRSPVASGLDAMGRVLLLLEGRRSREARFGSPEWAVANKALFRQRIKIDGQAVQVKMEALSPASATLTQAKLALIEHITNPVRERSRVVAFDKANQTSVVVWLEVGANQMLFGGDLEDSPHVNEGWRAIVNGSSQLNGCADVFKVPHHGSKNAHNDGVWHRLLAPAPFAIVTPWLLAGRRLPQSGDVARILSFTPNAYLTTTLRPRKSKFRDKATNRTFREATHSSDSLQQLWGHVRLRRPILDLSVPWSVELFGRAGLLT
jgi:hypothetical protein